MAVLAYSWTGYLHASLRALAARGVDLLVVHQDTVPDVAYEPYDVTAYAAQLTWVDEAGAGAAVEAVAAFAPDVVLVHSWHFEPYRAVLRSLPDGVLRVLWMDNVWRSTAKQWVGRAIAPVYVQRLFDAVMVPGDRTEFFAHRLGFAPGDVVRGSLSADTSTYFSGPREGAELAGRAAFVAALRLVHHKGADVLAEAYGRYRALCREAGTVPWALEVAGLGPLEEAFAGVDGVRMHGFVQPAGLGRLMRASSCLVNPSREEPYGVVLHEAVLCGLPVLSSHAVGAAPTFVADGQNGWTVTGGDAVALAAAMARMSAQPAERLGEMSAVSRSLSVRASPEGWARHLHEQLAERVR